MTRLLKFRLRNIAAPGGISYCALFSDTSAYICSVCPDEIVYWYSVEEDLYSEYWMTQLPIRVICKLVCS